MSYAPPSLLLSSTPPLKKTFAEACVPQSLLWIRGLLKYKCPVQCSYGVHLSMHNPSRGMTSCLTRMHACRRVYCSRLRIYMPGYASHALFFGVFAGLIFI
ncbi:unnamed protein product [Discosporangium mesarthrocarpum]